MGGATDNIHYNEVTNTFYVGIIPKTWQFLVYVEQVKHYKDRPKEYSLYGGIDVIDNIDDLTKIGSRRYYVSNSSQVGISEAV